MPVNASLLQIPDLVGAIQRGNQAYQQQQQTNIGNATNFLGAVGQSMDQYHINQALGNNFDSTTGQVNQKGVMSDLYNYKPMLAQQYGQNLLQRQLANQTALSNINKTNAEASNFTATAGKTGQETQGLALDQQVKKMDQVGQIILGVDPNNPNSFNNAVQYAKSQGLDTSLFANVDPNNPQQIQQAKQQAYGTLITAKDQINNQIQQQNANSATANSQANIMNAQTQQGQLGVAQQNANTEQFKAQQQVPIEQAKVNIEAMGKGVLTPQQQIDASLNFQKAQIEQAQKNIDNTSKYTSSVTNFNHANNMIDTFKQQAIKIASNPLISSGGVDQNGNLARDKSNNIIPAQQGMTGLGTAYGNAMLHAPGSNAYKQAQADYEMLMSYAKGKGLTDLKTYSQNGATGMGNMSNQESNLVGAMQGVPDFETFTNMNPNARVQLMQKIFDAADRDTANNKAQIEKANGYLNDIKNQQVQAPVIQQPQYRNLFGNQNQGGQQTNQLYNNQGLPTSMPPMNQPYKDPNSGYMLMPKQAQKVEAFFKANPSLYNQLINQ